VRLARDGEPVAPGAVLVAPDDHHLRVSPAGSVQITQDPPMFGLRPAANYLFSSAAAAYAGRVLGIILSGMGADGAEGAVAIRRQGGLVLAESAETAAVFGMPRAAEQAGGVDEMLPMSRLASRAAELIVQRCPFFRPAPAWGATGPTP